MYRIERGPLSVGTTTGMQVTLPPMVLIRSDKLLGALHVSQQHDLIGFPVNLIQFAMTPLVRISIYQEPVIVNEMLMTI